MALVFDSLSPEALAMCQRAALDYVKMSGDTDARIGVFVTDPYVRVVQRYTGEPALIRSAVQRLLASGTEQQSARAERLEQLRARRGEMDASGISQLANTVTGTGNLSQAATAIGQAEVQRRLVQGEMRHAAGVRFARPRPSRLRHHQLAAGGARVDGLYAGPEERRIFFGGSAGVAGHAVPAAVA